MTKMNPFANEPSYVSALRNALEGRQNQYVDPPRSGGKKQTSIRLDDNVSLHIEEISKITGWNYNQIISSFIRNGLFNLYEFTQEDIVNKIIVKLKIDLEGIALANQAKRIISELIFILSSKSSDLDDWEAAHLKDAIDSLRSGYAKYAIIIANKALVPVEQRSTDPQYVKIIPKNNESINDLKKYFEELI